MSTLNAYVPSDWKIFRLFASFFDVLLPSRLFCFFRPISHSHMFFRLCPFKSNIDHNLLMDSGFRTKSRLISLRQILAVDRLVKIVWLNIDIWVIWSEKYLIWFSLEIFTNVWLQINCWNHSMNGFWTICEEISRNDQGKVLN